MIKFACSNCGRHISVDDKHAGKKGKCPKCGNALVVPQRSTIIEFPCEACGHTIKVPERYAGKKGKCPKCKNEVLVPVPQEEPAEEGGTASITCAMCGQAVEVAAASGEAITQCPECGSYIDAASGSPVPESDAPMPAGTDEDLYEGPPEAPQRSMGVDRRLIILLSGAAAIVVVGLVVLVVVLRPSGSRAARQREVGNAESRPQPTTSGTQPVEPDVQESTREYAPPGQGTEPTGSTDAAGAIRLQFSPAPGPVRTVEVTTRLVMSGGQGEQQFDVTDTKSFTLGLEVTEAPADGTIPVRVTLATIRETSAMQGKTMGEYDSAQPHSSDDPMASIYAPFIGQSCTVKVSSRGEIIDLGLDELFLAAAEHRMKAEDDQMRERLREKADRAINHTDQRVGSREKRRLALKKQLEEFPVFGREDVRGLLRNLMVSVPEHPVRAGDSWNSPIAVELGALVQMAGTYTLTAVEDGSCTITAQGQRSLDEEPFVYEVGPTKVTNKLGGASEATLRVDRRTGWLVGKEQKTNLSGEIERSTTGPQAQDTRMQVSMEVTTTVNLVK